MTNLPNTAHGTTKIAFSFVETQEDRADGWLENIILVRDLHSGEVYSASGVGPTMKAARSHARIVTARHSALLRHMGQPGLTALN